MDVASHWLMGSGATSGRTEFWVAGLMGVLPDLLVFIPNSFFLDERPKVNADTLQRISVGMHGRRTKSHTV